MPSRAYIDSPDGSPAGASLFRKNTKRLPHPPNVTSTSKQSTPVTGAYKPRDLAIDTAVPSVSGSDTSSPHTLKHASRRIGAPDLPPTPPSHSRQFSRKQQPNITLSSPADSAPGTPTHNSPPTPDVTPPRNMPPLAFRPVAGERMPSSTSRTDSFKTARENPYSSDEEDEASTVRPRLPSARPSESETPQISRKNQRQKTVGLGLGLESEGTATPRVERDPHQEFVIFDGEWGSAGEEDEVEHEWDDNLMRNVMVRKRPGPRLYVHTDESPAEVLEDNIVPPTLAAKVVRSLPLQERIAKHRLERDVDNFGDRIAMPTAVPEPISPTTPDIRRFSAMSGRSMNSTVIEALVVEAPPLRQKTLRHSKKQLGLRDFSDQSTRSSAPNSVVSGEQPHKLVHKRSPIPERRQRSLASNKTASTSSSSGRSRKEVIKDGGIPVVVIPDRRSSTRSSKPHSLRSTSSRKTKRSMSLGSAPISQSSKFNEPGYFDAPPTRKRTMSESAGSGHSVRTIDFPPTIPARRSSLSAPTSRNTSRAGSLTTESLQAHNMLQQKTRDMLKHDPVQNQISPGNQRESLQTARLAVDHNGDPFFGNRLSTQVTPFSQISYETAGTAAEVSEARTVSIFPHQNKSLLVVQQQGAGALTPPSQAVRPKLETGQPSISINGKGPETPPQPAHPMDEVDSPLRNPREPPAIKFIPPTPADLTPSQEESRQLGYDERPATSDDKPKRGISIVRRALSGRRNSEPAVTGSLFKRTFSLNGRRKNLTDESTQTSKAIANPSMFYPSVEDHPADTTKLHPFWRPARFWDDLEDHDDTEDDEEVSRFPFIHNRPTPPTRSLSGKLKRTFAILPIKDEDEDRRYYTMERRSIKRTSSGTMRVVKQRSNSSLKRAASDSRRYEPQEPRFGHGFPEGNGGKRIHTIPGLGVRVEFVGWSGMKRRLSEKRREERSEKLRASISSPKRVHSGIDDVLRKRTVI
ncbi:hypothetical protein B0O99DRAFT_510124 [Bisporella sp. PMI_857]|nr:hypothetical protein B0O99DRAFT_510124 [Bisporella sp. PMI_857]